MHFLPKQNININNFPPQQSKVDWLHAPSSIQQHPAPAPAPAFHGNLFISLCCTSPPSQPFKSGTRLYSGGGEWRRGATIPPTFNLFASMQRNEEHWEKEPQPQKREKFWVLVVYKCVPNPHQRFYKGLSNIDIIIYFWQLHFLNKKYELPYIHSVRAKDTGTIAYANCQWCPSVHHTLALPPTHPATDCPMSIPKTWLSDSP